MNPTQPTSSSRRPHGSGADARHGGGDSERNVLIVALDAVVPAEATDAEVLVIAPALNSWLRRWVSDEDTARRRAEERLARYVDHLKRCGVHARGRVGDSDPLQAIADALPMFAADEIVIASESERSTRLADELVARAKNRFALPIVRAEKPLTCAA